MKNKIIIIISIFIIIVLIITLLRIFVFKDDYIDIIKENTDIDPYLILSIIKTESNFNPKATSNKEAKGLMQLLDSTYNEVSDNENIYDEENNIKAGINYFENLLDRYNDNIYLSILAYNAGIGNVDDWIEEDIINYDLDYLNDDIPFKETKNYLRKIIYTYKIYNLIY